MDRIRNQEDCNRKAKASRQWDKGLRQKENVVDSIMDYLAKEKLINDSSLRRTAWSYFRLPRQKLTKQLKKGRGHRQKEQWRSGTNLKCLLPVSPTMVQCCKTECLKAPFTKGERLHTFKPQQLKLLFNSDIQRPSLFDSLNFVAKWRGGGECFSQSCLMTDSEMRLTVERKSAPVSHIYFRNIFTLTFQVCIFLWRTNSKQVHDKYITKSTNY